jgi:hypothetical protein
MKKMKLLSEDALRKSEEHNQLKLDICLERYRKLTADVRELKQLIRNEACEEEQLELKSQLDRLLRLQQKCELELDAHA